MNRIVKFLFIVVAPAFALAASFYGAALFNIPFDIKVTDFTLKSTWATFIIFLYIAISTVVYVYTTYSETLADRDRQIQELVQEKRDMARELQNNAGGLWRELKYLSKYKQDEILAEIMDTFTKNNPSVVSVQLYEYFFKTRGMTALTEVTEVKINHTVGIAKEGQNQNAILQAYYSIPSFIFNAFIKARAIADLRYYDLGKALTRFAIKYAKQLNAKRQQDLTKQDVCLLAILTLAFEKLGLSDDLRVSRHDEYLHNMQKNGILRGIIDNGEYYTFTYKSRNSNHNEKSTRTYVTKKVVVNGKQSIVVVTADIKDHLTDLHKLGEGFVDLLVASDLTVE